MSIRKEKIEFFETILADFHRKAGREHLPWRRKGIGAYEIWVSEIMLQQTQVSRVIGYYEKFLARFPDVGTLAEASWEEFLPYYQGLGYYARGRNMLRTAKVVVSEYGGKFPKDVKKLEKLSGVGPYTAAAIASFAHGKNAIAWDTNLMRVTGLNWISGGVPEKENLSVKLRHGPKEYPCVVQSRGDGKLEVKLDGFDRGIAPGQFAVFYDGRICLGGGVIIQ